LLTHDARPNSIGVKVSDIGRVSPGNPVSIDITPYISAGKTVSFMIATTSDDGVDYASKEASSDMSPQVLLSE
jgi:hypothetical protein